MHWLETVLIGIALSMDALAVSIVLGAAEPGRMTWKRILIIALFFGVFQAVMPLIGWYGCSLTGLIRETGHYFAAGLLGVIGGKMIYDRKEEHTAVFTLPRLFLLALATSIDAFLVGVGFACLQRPSILDDVLLIGLITFLISAAGCLAGRHSGKLLKTEHCMLIGGLVLIGIGVKTALFG